MVSLTGLSFVKYYYFDSLKGNHVLNSFEWIKFCTSYSIVLSPNQKKNKGKYEQRQIQRFQNMNKTLIFFSELDLLQAISVPFDDPKHVYFAEGLHGLHAFGLRAG